MDHLELIELLRRGLPADQMITHRFDIEDAPQAFSAFFNRRGGQSDYYALELTNTCLPNQNLGSLDSPMPQEPSRRTIAFYASASFPLSVVGLPLVVYIPPL